MNYILSRTPISFEMVLEIMDSSASYEEKHAKIWLFFLSLTSQTKKKTDSEEHSSKYTDDFIRAIEEFFSRLFKDPLKEEELWRPLGKLLDISLIFYENLNAATANNMANTDAKKLLRMKLSTNLIKFYSNMDPAIADKRFNDWRLTRKYYTSSKILTDLKWKQTENIFIKTFAHDLKELLESFEWKEKQTQTMEYIRQEVQKLLNIIYSNDENQFNQLVQAIKFGRIDKKQFSLINTLIVGDEAGIYALLNSSTKLNNSLLLESQIIDEKFLLGALNKWTNKLIIGKDGTEKMRFGLCLLSNKEAESGQIVFVKKTAGEKAAQATKGSNFFSTSYYEKVSIEFFCKKSTDFIFYPKRLDMAMISKLIENVSHSKGYILIDPYPKNTAKTIFSDPKFQKWEHQKAFLMDIFNSCKKILSKNMFYGELSPTLTLYDPIAKRGAIIDLGSSIALRDMQEMSNFNCLIRNFTRDEKFCPPEMSGKQERVDLYKAKVYICGKLMEAVTEKTDCEKAAIKSLILDMTFEKPSLRINLESAIAKLKAIGDNRKILRGLHGQYISKILKLLYSGQSALLHLGSDLVKRKKFYITNLVAKMNPFIYSCLESFPIEKVIEKFLNSNENDTLILLGAAETGKSFSLEISYLSAVENWRVGNPLPIYVDIDKEYVCEKIITRLNKVLGLKLKWGEYPVHLFVDNYNKINRWTLDKSVLGSLIQNKGKDSKIIITCRTDFFETDTEIENLMPSDYNSFSIFFLLPFNYGITEFDRFENVVKEYIPGPQVNNDLEKNVRIWLGNYGSTQEPFESVKKIEILDLKGKIENYLMFNIIMESLDTIFNLGLNKFTKFDLVTIYLEKVRKEKMSQFSSIQSKKIKDYVDSNQKGISFETADYIEYLGQLLAAEMHRIDADYLTLPQISDLKLGYTFESSKNFKDTMFYTLISLLPLKIDNYFGSEKKEIIAITFECETFKNYYLLKALYIESDKLKFVTWNVLDTDTILGNSELMRLFSECINDKLANYLRKKIEKSKGSSSKSAIKMARNAISLLAAARHSLSNQDLSNIKVPYADLSGGFFENTEFHNADLSNCNMSNCRLDYAEFIKANLSNVIFEVPPEIFAHSSSVNAIAFNPNGNEIASCSNDLTIKTWKISTGQNIRTFFGHTKAILCLTYNSNGTLIASGSADCSLKIWNIKATENPNHCTLRGHTMKVICTVFCPYDSFLVSGSQDSTVKVWEYGKGVCVMTFVGHSNEIKSVSVSPDSRLIASCSNDKTIMLWHVDSGAHVKTLIGHIRDVCVVVFSPGGEKLASGSVDFSIKLWALTDLSTAHAQSLIGHSGVIYCLSFNKNGSRLTSAASDNSIKVWDPDSGRCLFNFRIDSIHIKCMTISKDGNMAAAGWSFESIKFWEIYKNGPKRKTLGHTDCINCVNFSLDGKKIVSASDDQTIKVWDGTTGLYLFTLLGHIREVLWASFTFDGLRIVSVSLDGTIRYWDAINGACIQILDDLPFNINSINLSLLGKKLLRKVEACFDEEYEFSESFFHIRKFIICLAITNEGIVKIIGSSENSIEIWDLDTGSIFGEIFASGNVRKMALSHDGTIVALKMYDNILNVVESESGKEITVISGHFGEINCMCFSSDNFLLATCSDDKAVRIWEIESGTLLQALDGHMGSVKSISFSPDSKRLVSCSTDKTIKIWDSHIGLFTENLNDSITQLSPLSPKKKNKHDDLPFKEFNGIQSKSPVYSRYSLAGHISFYPPYFSCKGCLFEKSCISSLNESNLEQLGAIIHYNYLDNNEFPSKRTNKEEELDYYESEIRMIEEPKKKRKAKVASSCEMF